ncbi:cupin domain-containing protein [Streptomyces sp. RK62]|uniref:cupin domain-containing protein n=1 Tax=Streptomyces sp. RK62 TaxID=2824893 RepID=UPI001B38DE4A|nr:cupin domain-containing protein [Streptomyces sp. RK62]MBQ0997651.1 cupin domain-containing protein [Streptomyces sp. RK62]
MSFPLEDVAPDDPRWNRRGALYVPSGEGPTVWAANDVYTVKATGAQTGGHLGFVEATVPAGGGPIPHAHTHEDETFYVLDGELEFVDGDHEFTAVAGDFIHVPKGIRHGFKNRRIHAARLLFIYTPPGLEQLMLDHSVPARAGETPPPIDDDMAARAGDVIRKSRTIMLP